MSSQKEQGSDDNVSRLDFPLPWASESRSEELLLEPLTLSRGASALDDDGQDDDSGKLEDQDFHNKATPLSRLTTLSGAREAEEEEEYDSSQPLRTHRGEDRQSGSYGPSDSISDPLLAPGQGRRKKKPNGAPKRPMSSYNCFFKKERARLMDENNQAELGGVSVEASGKISFADLGRYIGAKWKTLSERERQEYKDLADKDLDRYRREMAEFERHRAETEEAQTSERRQPMRPDDFGSTDLPYFSSDSIATEENDRIPMQYAPFAPPAWMPGGYGHASPNNAGYGPPPSSMSMLPPGTEISIPHQDGNERRYVVNYCVFMVTPEEAQQYLASFPQMACFQGSPPSMYASLPLHVPPQNAIYATYGGGYYTPRHYYETSPQPPLRGPSPWPREGPRSSYGHHRGHYFS